ncbi:MAG: type II toxin-antitoxin system RelE/ParE family toxin [Aliivibrio sp.]|uniref:type II toxin-antitoxin system RelE/ParE family toxin n=1 Tax=Aliivibrio sp. TaxID=1872443 RepID=UPI001A42596F|nr:type II toxin-antitoxin system RelE/ParE family toxin [Aliivibrio sp.]
MNLVWSPLALEKLGDAAEFIALDNPEAAKNWVNEIFDKTDLLRTVPEMGRIVPEIPQKQFREILFGHYRNRIIYSLGLEIRILTVRNCRQILTESDV